MPPVISSTRFCSKPLVAKAEIVKIEKQNDMKLGAFSISLNVKDVKTSKEFYEKLGFKVFGGSMEHKYLIMKNGNALVGLFQGMFEGNILTFNLVGTRMPATLRILTISV